MDMRQLKALVRIAETGSFSEAARRLNVTQPALSRQIRLLEESLGEPLPLRTGRGAVPTEAGHLALGRADLILGEVEKARQAIAARKDAVTGRVAFGLPIASSPLVMAGLDPAIRGGCPCQARA